MSGAALLVAVALVVFALGALLVGALLATRAIGVMRARALRDAQERVRPLAIALASGEAMPAGPPHQGRRGRRAGHDAVLAGMLAGYSRLLDADARDPVARWFESCGAVAREVGALRDRRSWRRVAAAYALGNMASADAIGALVDSLGDPYVGVRVAAARSLGRLRAADAVAPLVRGMASGEIPVGAAGTALLNVGPVALPRLEAIGADADPHVREAAVRIIGHLGDPRHAVAMLARLRDTSAEVRARAAEALGRLGAADAVAALQVTLGDRVPFVRLHAARALGHLGDPAPLALLIAIADRDDVDVARAAASAALRIDPPAVIAASRASGSSDALREAADVAVATDLAAAA